METSRRAHNPSLGVRTQHCGAGSDLWVAMQTAGHSSPGFEQWAGTEGMSCSSSFLHQGTSFACLSDTSSSIRVLVHPLKEKGRCPALHGCRSSWTRWRSWLESSAGSLHPCMLDCLALGPDHCLSEGHSYFPVTLVTFWRLWCLWGVSVAS